MRKPRYNNDELIINYSDAYLKGLHKELADYAAAQALRLNIIQNTSDFYADAANDEAAHWQPVEGLTEAVQAELTEAIGQFTRAKAGVETLEGKEQ